jgi:hypothetical protein
VGAVGRLYTFRTFAVTPLLIDAVTVQVALPIQLSGKATTQEFVTPRGAVLAWLPFVLMSR